LWLLHSKILAKINSKEKIDNEENLSKFTNQLIHKITQNLEKFHYNVIVANLHEMYNFLIKEIDKPIDSKILKENYKKILITMMPFIPHLANECMENITNDLATWPQIIEDQLIKENINFVIQINGKKRAILNVKRDITEEDLLKEIRNDGNELKKFLRNQSIKKTIFISNRLINIIL